MHKFLKEVAVILSHFRIFLFVPFLKCSFISVPAISIGTRSCLRSAAALQETRGGVNKSILFLQVAFTIPLFSSVVFLPFLQQKETLPIG